jgi:hypothetical protein
LFTTLSFGAELTSEQQQVPLEVAPKDAALAKIILIAGEPSNKAGQHEYFAGCALMMEWLKKVPGVAPVLVANGWPKNEAILDGARCVVLYMDGGAKLTFLDAVRWARMQSLEAAGAGFVVLHQGIDCPPLQSADFQKWFGASFQSDIGCRGHWDVEFTEIGKHPAVNGVKPFALLKDGWLYNLHFAASGVTHLLQCQMPDKSRTTADAKTHVGRAETVAWCYDRANGGRSFGFTGCDLHANWAVDGQRRLLLNGILWSAKLEVPANGIDSTCTPEMLTQNMDRKVFAKKANHTKTN